MGSFLQKLLTNPEDFKFYTGNQKGVVSPNNQNPRTIPFGRDRFNDGLKDGSNQRLNELLTSGCYEWRHQLSPVRCTIQWLDL